MATAHPALIPPSPDDAARAAREQLQATVIAGAKWFYWIAGLSLVNSLMSFFGSDRRFVIGLGITEVVDFMAKGSGAAGGIVHVAVDLFVVGMFVFFGYKACQRIKAAFLTGMIVYVLDAGLLLLGQDFFSVAFHGLALFYIFRGFSANNQLRALDAAAVSSGLSPAPIQPE